MKFRYFVVEEKEAKQVAELKEDRDDEITM